MRRQRHRPLPPQPTPSRTEEALLRERKLYAEREMWAFDHLPPALRRAVARAGLGPNAQQLRFDMVELAARFRLTPHQIADFMAVNLEEAEDAAINAFAANYERSHGTPLPHAAAGVSVLRPPT